MAQSTLLEASWLLKKGLFVSSGGLNRAQLSQEAQDTQVKSCIKW